MFRPATVGFFFGILKLSFFSFKINSFLTITSSILTSLFFEGFFKGLSIFIEIFFRISSLLKTGFFKGTTELISAKRLFENINIDIEKPKNNFFLNFLFTQNRFF